MTVVILAALPFITGDLETKELNDKVRKGLDLKFIQLTDGMVHYEVSGPEQGETVVLVHGNAAPYFSWDINMQALTDAGFLGLSDTTSTVLVIQIVRMLTTSRALYDRQL